MALLFGIGLSASAAEQNLYTPGHDTENYYVLFSSGELLYNQKYSATDFIPVQAGKHYIIPRNRMLAFYNPKHVYISGIENGKSPLEFTAPAGAAYVRISIDKKWDGFTMEEQEMFSVNLPSRICMYGGAPLAIYHHGLLENGAGEYFFKWSCPVGRAMKDALVFDVGIAPGIYPLKLEVFDGRMKKVAESLSELTVNNGSGKNRKIKLLVIGDSLSNDKPWINNLMSLAESSVAPGALTMVGTRGGELRHEARSGYTTDGYLRDSQYGYQGNYKLMLASADCAVPLKTRCKLLTIYGSYSDFEVEEISHKEGNWLYLNRVDGKGEPLPSGTVEFLRGDQAPGTDKVSYAEAVCTSYNPFWNPVNKSVDFAYYEKKTGVRPDVVVLFLGTNDYDSKDYTINMSSLIAALNQAWNVPVLVVLPPFRGPQDIMGRQFGTKMYSVEAHQTMFRQHRAALAELAGLRNVTLVPLSLCFDAENNYAGADAVHPAGAGKGYSEIADAIFGALLTVW
ncbi:MAG: SGNH/GDSL hydrolase family protein [Victivallaceae bacterium]|nr:SGNH/GDSL hydrolase family protein [Victivallaceae bacterium]